MSNRAFSDLMLAWAHARLGDPAQASPLAEDATIQLSTGDAAHRWLAAAFNHRIDEAARGEAHAGEWPATMLNDLAAVDSHLRYIIDQIRARSRILEPDLRANPFGAWMRHATPVSRAISDLETISEPDEFAARFQTALSATAGTDEISDRLRLIETAANHARRAPDEIVEAVSREGLLLVDQFLSRPPDFKAADYYFRVLVTALCNLAVWRRDHSLLGQMRVRLSNWIRYGNHTASYPFGRILLDALIPGLYRTDLATDAALLLDLTSEVGPPLCADETGSGDHLETQLQFAGCRRWLGQRAQSERVFEQARSFLFGDAARQVKPVTLVRVAEGYLLARGRGPAADFGPDLLDFFARLPRFPNGFTTATHFSRLHLSVVEAAVLAVTTDDFRTMRDLHARLGVDETVARRALIPGLRDRVRKWADPNW